MFEWIISNFSSILVGTVVAALLVMIILVMLRDKRQGKGSCGGNCKHCQVGCGYLPRSVKEKEPASVKISK